MGLRELYYAGSHGMDIMGPCEGPYSTKTNGQNNLEGKVCYLIRSIL